MLKNKCPVKGFKKGKVCAFFKLVNVNQQLLTNNNVFDKRAGHSSGFWWGPGKKQVKKFIVKLRF